MLKIIQHWRNLRSSLWFLPSILVMLAVVLAFTLIEVDTAVGHHFLSRWPRIFGAGADGTRGLLTTVATSMVTVVGVVFSITIVALSLASSQYTSRVLRNFMRDTVNQWVLGLMIGVFAYCLVVLRTIRGGDEGAFVPSLSALAGLALAFVGIAALIYFIHHISTSIQAAHIIAGAAEDTLRTVDRLYPEIAREEQELLEAALADDFWQRIPADRNGYLQSLDTKGLVRFAVELSTIVRLERRVGDFVIQGTPLFSVNGLSVLDEPVKRRLAAFHTIGRQRTIEQDAAFGIRQIVDVALKALSPGINDTTTAAMCVDYLTAILSRLGQRGIPTVHRDDEGQARLLLGGPTYTSLLADAIHEIRRSASGNAAIMESLLDRLQILSTRTAIPTRRAALRQHTEAIARAARRSIADPEDLEHIEAKVNLLLETLSPHRESTV